MVVLSALHAGVLGARAVLYRRKCAPDQRGVLGAESGTLRDALAEDAEGRLKHTAVTVLFARSDSIYKSIDGIDVWDADRDARKWPGGTPVVAHPPCRGWSRMRGFAKPLPDETGLGLWAVSMVREWGGVLEHPESSLLWRVAGLPFPGERDQWGGWTLPVHQFWWGHPCEKRTWLYVVGCPPERVPSIPLVLGEAPYVVSPCLKNVRRKRPSLSPADRERTPVAFANWLIDLGGRCKASREGIA